MATKDNQRGERMEINNVDVTQCKYLKVKNITLKWGIGKEYTKEYKCKKHNNLSCELFDECEYKRCKRLNDYLQEVSE